MTTNPDTDAAKAALRQAMRQRLKQLSEIQVERESRKLRSRLTSSDRWLRAGSHVALFGGITGEPDLLPLIPWLLEHGCVPVFFNFTDGQLTPKAVGSIADLERGVFGVWLPKPTLSTVDAAALNVILTPGLAFDSTGRRLGRGRGYYDRLFGNHQVTAQRVGVCFDFQCVEAVPVEIHDVAMHVVVTEAGVKTQN